MPTASGSHSGRPPPYTPCTPYTCIGKTVIWSCPIQGHSSPLQGPRGNSPEPLPNSSESSVLLPLPVTLHSGKACWHLSCLKNKTSFLPTPSSSTPARCSASFPGTPPPLSGRHYLDIVGFSGNNDQIYFPVLSCSDFCEGPRVIRAKVTI